MDILNDIFSIDQRVAQRAFGKDAIEGADASVNPEDDTLEKLNEEVEQLANKATGGNNLDELTDKAQDLSTAANQFKPMPEPKKSVFNAIKDALNRHKASREDSGHRATFPRS